MIFREVPLVFTDVTAGYGKLDVLQALNLEVPSGSVCALLGRNGAGKTTLLRTALGFLRTSSGRVKVLGEDAWTRRFALKDAIGYVAERQDLWPRMRGAELLRLASKLFSHWDPEIAERLVDRYGLPLDRRLGQLSKGMQIQIAQVVALAHRPQLLLLDEPVASMDPVVRTEFAERILGYVHDSGASVLYSTHLVGEVESLADRVAFLHDGAIVLEGTVDEVLGRYTRLMAVVEDHWEAAVDRLQPVSMHRQDEMAILTFAGAVEDVAERLESTGVGVLEARRPSLQELFIALLGEDNPRRDGSHASRRRKETA